MAPLETCSEAVTGSSKKHLGIFILSILATTFSIFGQNSFIGVFTNSIQDSLNISYTSFGIILMLATLLSSVLVGRATRLLDTAGLLPTIVAMSVPGAISLLIFSQLSLIASYSGNRLWSLLALGFCLACLRLCFRGMFRIISSSMVTQYFRQNSRSVVFAGSGVISVLLASMIPLTSHKLISTVGLGGLFLGIVGCLMLFLILAWLFLGNTRQRHVTGSPDPSKAQSESDSSIRLEESRKDLTFWIYMIGLPFYSLLLSSVMLFLIPITEHHHIDYSQGLLIYFPAAIIGFPFFVLASMKMRYTQSIFLAYQTSIFISFFGFLHFDKVWGQIAAAFGFGISSALYQAMSQNLWSTLYGAADVNRYLGLASSFDLFAAAIGPVLVGFFIDQFSIMQMLAWFSGIPLVIACFYGVIQILNRRPTGSRPTLIVTFDSRLLTRLRLLQNASKGSLASRSEVIKSLLSGRVIPFWKISLMDFPNQLFKEGVWDLLSNSKADGESRFLVFNPLSTHAPWSQIDTAAYLKSQSDRVNAFRAIYYDTKAIFSQDSYARRIHEPDGLYFVTPKSAVKREIMESQELKDLIANHPQLDPIKAGKLAIFYIDEIVSNRIYFVCSLMSKAVDWFLKRLFFNIEMIGTDQLKDLDKKYQIVYLPSHRSHVDFLAVSHLLYLHNVEAPYIATSQHLDFFPAKYVQNISGYFIRRKKMDAIYNAVLYQYIAIMQQLGHPQMVFIEGTRSKTGETLQPKAGMLSQYVNAFIEKRGRPVIFIPTNITYDRVMEGDSYLSYIVENQNETVPLFSEQKKAYQEYKQSRKDSGRLKRIFKMFKALRSLQPRGNAYITFGDPIYLERVLDQIIPDWKDKAILREDSIPDPWIRSVAHTIAKQACVEINSRSPLTPNSLAATALLASRGQALTENELLTFVASTAELWKMSYGFEIKHVDDGLEKTLLNVPHLNQCRRRGERRSDNVPLHILNQRKSDRRTQQKIFLAPLDSLRSTYNRNNIKHAFVIPFLVSKVMTEKGKMHETDLRNFIMQHFDRYRLKYHLAWDTNESWQRAQDFIQYFAAKNFFVIDRSYIAINQDHPMAFRLLSIYANTLDDEHVFGAAS